jgi:hypothetical protein
MEVLLLHVESLENAGSHQLPVVELLLLHLELFLQRRCLQELWVECRPV